jgi:hypothetical protein
LFEAIKEIIPHRYSRKHLDTTTFTVKIVQDDKVLYEENSRAWKSFADAMEFEVQEGRARLIRGPRTGRFGSGKWEAKEYDLEDDSVLSKIFQKYGTRTMDASRTHMSLDGRCIEARHLHKMMGISNSHNSKNGRISIVNFVPDLEREYISLPTPATTKIAFSDTCLVFQKFIQDIKPFWTEPEIAPERDLPVNEINGLKGNQLKSWCSHYKLSKDGKVPELKARLHKHLSPQPLILTTDVAETPAAAPAATAATAAQTPQPKIKKSKNQTEPTTFIDGKDIQITIGVDTFIVTLPVGKTQDDLKRNILDFCS